MQRQAPRRPAAQYRVILGIVIWTYALALGAVLGTLFTLEPVLAQTPEPTPGLDIQITASRDSVQLDLPLTLFVIVTNKTSLDVSNLTMTLANADFSAVKLPTFPSPFSAHASVQGTAVIRPTATSAYGQNKVLFAFTYSWPLDNRQIQSIQGVAVPVQVTRPFDEEAKGFLGGNGAFLYLLLPVVPLFLGYQLVDSLRTRKVLAVPSFSTDYVIPAFLIAVILNLVVLIGFKQLNIDSADPQTALGTLIGSFVVGIVFSGLLWGARNLYFSWSRGPWIYKEDDPAGEYARKVLLRPNAPRTYDWVTGIANGVTWEGIGLTQPTGELVLGATLQLSRREDGGGDPAADRAPSLETLRETVVANNGEIKDPKELVRLIRSGKLTTQPLNIVKQGGHRVEGLVQVSGLEGFDRTTAEKTMLVRWVT